MNFSLVFKYFGILAEVAAALEGIAASIAAAQPASTPPINTYLLGIHGSLTLVWTPLGQPVNSAPSVSSIEEAHSAALSEPTGPASEDAPKPYVAPVAPAASATEKPIV